MVVLVLFFVVLGSVIYFGISMKNDVADEPESRDQGMETSVYYSEEDPAGSS